VLFRLRQSTEMPSAAIPYSCPIAVGRLLASYPEGESLGRPMVPEALSPLGCSRHVKDARAGFSIGECQQYFAHSKILEPMPV
jgi:hypothetical protein